MVKPINKEESIEFLEEIVDERKRAFVQGILDQALKNMMHFPHETIAESMEKFPKADVDFLFLAKVVKKFLDNKQIHKTDTWLTKFFENVEENYRRDDLYL